MDKEGGIKAQIEGLVRKARLQRFNKRKMSACLHTWGLADGWHIPGKTGSTREVGLGGGLEESAEVWDSL